MSSPLPLLDFVRWQDTVPPAHSPEDIADAERAPPGPSPFPADPLINSKLSLCRTELCRLKADGIVHSTVTTFEPVTHTGSQLLLVGGHKYKAAVEAAEKCRTGEATFTVAGDLPAKRVIHTVVPRYSEKFKTAVDSALFGCYYSSLRVMKEQGLRTLAIPCLYDQERGFPMKECAHIAIRTVRRFLEHYGDAVDRIAFVMPDATEELTYLEMLPLYFPRNAAEEALAKQLLPEDIGDEKGGPVVEERKIRIAELPPGMSDGAEGGDSDAVGLAKPGDVARDSAFSSMRDDPDAMRRAEEEATREFDVLLGKSDSVDLTGIAGLNLVYQSGVDTSGLPVLVFVMSHVPAYQVSFDEILMYLFRTVEDIVESPFTAIILNSKLSSRNQPSFQALARAVKMLPRLHRKNLKRLYIVHPNFWIKSALMFLRATVSKKFYNKITYVDSVKALLPLFDRGSLILPQHVYRTDVARMAAAEPRGGAGAAKA